MVGKLKFKKHFLLPEAFSALIILLFLLYCCSEAVPGHTDDPGL